jgi:hypothetical protein
MVVALASRTGWARADLLDMTLEELAAWLAAANTLDPRL